MSDLKLDWAYDRERGTALAQVGPYWLHVGDPGTSAKCWWTINPGNRRNYGAEGKSDTLIAAQLAAESAAVDLLCASLAVFADGAPESAISYQPDGTPWRTGVAPERFAKLEPELARRLAIALLAATRRDGK